MAAEGNGNGRNGRNPLPWLQFAWTIGVAVVGGAISGVVAYYGLRDSMRQEVLGLITQAEQRVIQSRREELEKYLPLYTYWQWREETNRELSAMQRTLDRIDYAVRGRR